MRVFYGTYVYVLSVCKCHQTHKALPQYFVHRRDPHILCRADRVYNSGPSDTINNVKWN